MYINLPKTMQQLQICESECSSGYKNIQNWFWMILLNCRLDVLYLIIALILAIYRYTPPQDWASISKPNLVSQDFSYLSWQWLCQQISQLVLYEQVELGENHIEPDHEQNGDQFVCVSCVNVGLDWNLDA